MKDIDWSKQHCGIHQGLFADVQMEMSDVAELILETFPENVSDFIWDINVHNCHYDNLPRVNNEQDFSLVQVDKPMCLWVSSEPLSESMKNGVKRYLKPKIWRMFTQEHENRGTRSEIFTWRGFIRATHKDIAPSKRQGKSMIIRHSQIYLDSSNFSW